MWRPAILLERDSVANVFRKFGEICASKDTSKFGICYLPFERNLQKNGPGRLKRGSWVCGGFICFQKREKREKKGFFFRKESTPNKYLKFYWDFLNKTMTVIEFIVILITMMAIILQLKTKRAMKTNNHSYT